MRTVKTSEAKTTKVGALIPGDYFFFTHVPEVCVRTKTGYLCVPRAEHFEIQHWWGSETLPCKSLDDTYEDAVEQNTPKALTFGDLEVGEEFTFDCEHDWRFLKIEQGRLGGSNCGIYGDAVWLKDRSSFTDKSRKGFPCFFRHDIEVERIEEDS